MNEALPAVPRLGLGAVIFQDSALARTEELGAMERAMIGDNSRTKLFSAKDNIAYNNIV